MVKLLKYSEKLKPLFTVGQHLGDAATRKAFELYTSILLEAVEDVSLESNATISSDTRFCKATGTWTHGAAHASTVAAIEVTDPTGTTTTGSAFTLVLPRYNTGKDPNVYANDILTFAEIDGTKYATGEAYLDAKVGTIRALYHDDIPHGWEWCDGTGSTPDLKEQFLYGAFDNTEIGTTGGSTTHKHAIPFSERTMTTVGIGDDVVSADSFGCTGEPIENDDPLCNAVTTHLPPFTKVYWIIRVGPGGEVAL